MRGLFLRLAVLLVLPTLFVTPRTVSADSGLVALTPPTGLALMASGTTRQLPAGSWLSATKLDARFQVQVTDGPVTPEVEIEPLATPFTGKATFQGAPLSSTGVAVVPIQGLVSGKTYHWQARVTDGGDVSSPWVPYALPGSSGPDIGIDTEAPGTPTITSPTDPRQSAWYRNRTIQIHWSATDRVSGIQGYSFALGRSMTQVPSDTVTTATGANISNVADGVWYLAVKAADKAGNWGPVSRFRFQLDRVAPRVTWLSPNRFSFNPYRGTTTVRFRVSEAASARLALYRVGAKSPTARFWFPHLRAGAVTSISWSGKDRQGQPVPRGFYFFSVQALDRAGNIRRVSLGGIDVVPERPVTAVGGITLFPWDGRRIIVVLSQQTLYAYDGDRLALRTYVTTGNPSLPTPPGSYQIMAKYHPYEMVSPWPPGSPYYYSPSSMQYAMLFRDGGYFIHDAPWRSAFGPGTNGPGRPGTNYGGTHGCVNVPPGAMSFLFSWASVGTSVQVVP